MSLSAKRLGEKHGMNAQEVNVLLANKGLLSGTPGNYCVTELGKKYVVEKYADNGYGGYAARGWEWLEWPDNLFKELKVSKEDRKQAISDAAENRRNRNR